MPSGSSDTAPDQAALCRRRVDIGEPAGGAAPVPDRLRSTPRWQWGLRTRITVYTSAVIAATLAAAFFWSVYELRADLQAHNDLFLRQEFTEFAAILQREVRKPANADPLAAVRAEAEINKEAGMFVVLRHEGLAHIFPEKKNIEPLAEAVQAAQLDETPATIDAQGQRVLAVRRVISIPNIGTWTIDAGLRLAQTEQTVASFTRRLAGGSAAFLAVAVLGGLFLTRQALRPVAASIRSAQQLNPNDLSVRLPRTGAEDELDLLAATINDLLERLNQYHEQIIRFTADASHELRGPLAAMRAGIEVALQQPRSADDYRESLETLGEQCQTLTDLVNKLLLLARADAGQVELRRDPVELAALIAEAVETYRPLADEKRITLEWNGSEPVWCPGDRMRLSQLVMNLLDNAIKYTDAQGMVRLELAAEGDLARLTVEDTGIGIAADRLPHIFERFFQVEKSRSQGGGGLGLSICRWVAAAHKGSIDVTSQPGRGSTFHFTLPRGESSPPAVAGAAGVGASANE
ncbi:MAG: sensor histidine kinase [Deltaproteobacteria bacterium]